MVPLATDRLVRTHGKADVAWTVTQFRQAKLLTRLSVTYGFQGGVAQAISLGTYAERIGGREFELLFRFVLPDSHLNCLKFVAESSVSTHSSHPSRSGARWELGTCWIGSKSRKLSAIWITVAFEVSKGFSQVPQVLCWDFVANELSRKFLLRIVGRRH